ncbi:MCE family protein [Nocardioides daejeonensis]|uniref:MCE family protein n=1 Tax=Nocardioides daejeonensis TaxID=1046556 RepID=UPI000D746A99|nr:MCE family protein [Nocardioides daejeonensis]
MARSWSSRLVGTGLALALLTGVGACDFDGAADLPLPGGGVSGPTYELTADFDDVMNVVPKSPVMVDDVPVGTVTDVERVGWDARITMKIRQDVELPQNTIAEIRQTSLLGEKYVALDEPTEPPVGRLKDGDRIPRSATGSNPEVEEVLGALSFLLSGGGVGQLGTITHELNEVMNGRTDKMRSLLGSLDNVVGILDDQKIDIVHALESLNRLTAKLNQERGVIGAALDTMGPAVEVLADQQKNLVTMLRSLDELGRVGTRVIRASKTDLLAVLDDLRPILYRLNEAGESLPRGLSLLLSFPFPDKARTIVFGDYANAEIRLDINLENFIGKDPIINPGETLSDLQQCLQSGSLFSKACGKFISDVDLFAKLKRACNAGALRNNPVCRVIQLLPDLGSLLGGITGTGGVGRLQKSMLSGVSSSSSTDLYGEGLT